MEAENETYKEYAAGGSGDLADTSEGNATLICSCDSPMTNTGAQKARAAHSS